MSAGIKLIVGLGNPAPNTQSPGITPVSGGWDCFAHDERVANCATTASFTAGWRGR